MREQKLKGMVREIYLMFFYLLIYFKLKIAVLQKCFIYLNRFGVDTKNSKAPMTISYILWSLAHAPHDFKVFNTVIYNDVTKYIQVHGLKNFKGN